MFVGTTKHYCFDCGSRLVYYANLSNPKAPNEYRVLVYGCMNCSRTGERPKVMSVKRNKSEDPIEAMRIQIEEETQPPIKNSNL